MGYRKYYQKNKESERQRVSFWLDKVQGETSFKKKDKYQEWSKNEEDYLKKYSKKGEDGKPIKTIPEIAIDLKRSYFSIQNKLKLLRKEYNDGNRLFKSERKKRE